MDDPRPLVRVAHPEVPDYTDPGNLVELTDLLYVHCSVCDVVADYDDTTDSARHRLQELARRHADEQHDADVDAEGWTR